MAMGKRFVCFRAGALHPIMALLICCSTILAGQTGTKSPEPRIPRDPDPPTVDIKEKNRVKPEDVAVTVETVKGEPKDGLLILDFDQLEIEVMYAGAVRKESIPVASIYSIEFIQWHGTERRKNEFAFYPVRTRVILKDKKEHIREGNIPELNKLMLKTARGNRSLFAYFYDYRKNNVWLNSGVADMRYPETNPPAGTLLRITFHRTEEKNWLERLLMQ